MQKVFSQSPVGTIYTRDPPSEKEFISRISKQDNKVRGTQIAMSVCVYVGVNMHIWVDIFEFTDIHVHRQNNVYLYRHTTHICTSSESSSILSTKMFYLFFQSHLGNFLVPELLLYTHGLTLYNVFFWRCLERNSHFILRQEQCAFPMQMICFYLTTTVNGLSSLSRFSFSTGY